MALNHSAAIMPMNVVKSSDFTEMLPQKHFSADIIFTIKEPQERSGLFAVARSPNGSLITKTVQFSSRGQISGFSSQRKSVEKVADYSASYHAVRCVSTLRIISQTRWRYSFRRRSVQVLPSSKTCQKGFGRFIPSPSRFSA